jgi:hypothetical protein
MDFVINMNQVLVCIIDPKHLRNRRFERRRRLLGLSHEVGHDALGIEGAGRSNLQFGPALPSRRQ